VLIFPLRRIASPGKEEGGGKGGEGKKAFKRERVEKRNLSPFSDLQGRGEGGRKKKAGESPKTYPSAGLAWPLAEKEKREKRNKREGGADHITISLELREGGRGERGGKEVKFDHKLIFAR